MPTWFWVALTVMHLVSIAWFFLVWRDLVAFRGSQIWVMGKNNEPLVGTLRLKFLRIVYGVLILGLSLASYIFFAFIL